MACVTPLGERRRMAEGGSSMVANSKARFLAEDIWDTPDDGNRYEVIDGELYVSPPPVREHQHASFELGYFIRHYLEEHPIGVAYAAPFGVILTGLNGLQPDLIYISNERRGILTDQGVSGAPDLVIEILSPSTRSRDLGIKLRAYQGAGVPNYWIADPRDRTLQERVLGENGYGPPTIYRVGETFQPTLFPGLSIEVARLWP
jgi:Uma2 family endonuclease